MAGLNDINGVKSYAAASWSAVLCTAFFAVQSLTRFKAAHSAALHDAAATCEPAWPSGLFEGAQLDVFVLDVHGLAAVELEADVAFRAAFVVGQFRRDDAVDFHRDVAALGR